MSFEPPTREDLLQAATPAALFGAALADPKALRRAYAALIRAFRPDEDPAAFEHVRRLYEEARRSPLSDPIGPKGPDGPVEALRQAFAERDLQAVYNVVSTRADALLVEAPDGLVEALEHLIRGGGPALGPVPRQVVSVVLSRPDLPAPPQLVAALERDLIRLEELARAEEDAAVPRPIVEAVARSWYRPPDTVAEAWLEASAAVPDNELAPTFAYLETAHPTVLGMMAQAEARMQAACEEPSPDEEALAAIRADMAFESSGEERLLARLAAVPTTGLLFVVVLGGAFVGVPLPVRAVVVAIVLLLRYGVPRRLELLRQRRDEVLRGPTRPLIEAARALALWPTELVGRLVPLEPVPFSETEYGYPPDHALLRFRTDPAAVLAVMTPAHVERVRRGLAVPRA